MNKLSLADISSTNNIAAGSTDFADTIRIVVKHTDSPVPRVLYIHVYALSTFQILDELDVKEVSKAFIMTTYDFNLIKQ